MAATQLTSNSNSKTARPALTGVSAEPVLIKQLVKVTKVANMEEATKVSPAITMATTSSNAADGAATTEGIK